MLRFDARFTKLDSSVASEIQERGDLEFATRDNIDARLNYSSYQRTQDWGVQSSMRQGILLCALSDAICHLFL